MTKPKTQEPRMTVRPPRSAGGSGETMVEADARREQDQRPAPTVTPAAAKKKE